ncbi:MAG: protein-glutamate O-methyltransferase CheR [Oscillospiraceae bacterium]|nr:protein-glutamate O-methyltransferase CheR [Oscillospiraceae bacterium]
MAIDDRDFTLIRDFMLRTYGINLEKKRVLVEGRLTSLVDKNGFGSFHDYLSYAMSNPTLQQEMVTRLTTNFTFFLREGIHYDFMVKTAIPSIQKKNPVKNNLKIWSAGCSSGDEVYTAAMFLREEALKSRRFPAFHFQATDISDDALREARAAVYADSSLKNLPPDFQSKYLRKTDEPGKWKVVPEISGAVTFSKLNLIEPFPLAFHNFDIIFCRNVMIYFTSDISRQLAKKYFNALNPGGYLFVGMSETIPAAEIGFKMIRPSIFYKER